MRPIVRLSRVDLLVLTSLDQIIYLRYKTSYLNVEINCTEPSPSISVPWINIEKSLFVLIQEH